MPSLVALLLLAVWVLAGTVGELRCVDAARAAARAQARGDDGALAGRLVAPSGATVRASASGTDVVATVDVTLRPLGHALPLPGLHLHARAVAEQEGTPPGGSP